MRIGAACPVVDRMPKRREVLHRPIFARAQWCQLELERMLVQVDVYSNLFPGAHRCTHIERCLPAEQALHDIGKRLPLEAVRVAT